MQLKIYTVPIFDAGERNEEMNKFLRAHRVVTVDKQFCTVDDLAYWTFCITYVESPVLVSAKTGEQREKIDYREVLDTNTFAIFSRLREIRKALATEDAVPAYAVFTDAELAEISKMQPMDERMMLKINGLGKARVEKYGRKICQRYHELQENIPE